MQAIRCPKCQTLVGEFVFKSNHPAGLIDANTNALSKEIVWLKDPSYRPFCSKRCQTLDLGAWADGSYSIPTTLPPNEDEEYIINPPETD